MHESIPCQELEAFLLKKLNHLPGKGPWKNIPWSYEKSKSSLLRKKTQLHVEKEHM